MLKLPISMRRNKWVLAFHILFFALYCVHNLVHQVSSYLFFWDEFATSVVWLQSSSEHNVFKQVVCYCRWSYNVNHFITNISLFSEGDMLNTHSLNQLMLVMGGERGEWGDYPETNRLSEESILSVKESNALFTLASPALLKETNTLFTLSNL